MEKITNSNVLRQLLNYAVARIDIKNYGNSDNSINIISNSDKNSDVAQSKWFRDNNGIGTVVQSIQSTLDLKLKCINDGELNIILRSKDVRDSNNNRFPIYIDYTSFMVNGIPLLNGHNLISHDSPFYFKKSVKDSEIIDIHCEWLPFNSDCEFKSTDVVHNNFLNLEKEFINFKKYANEYFESSNFLFNNIFLDYSHTPTQLMADLKTACIELLSFIDNICKKHDLKWWLDYGNLLGAVRHGDFIPWDDDIDIAMMREDYNKLVRIIGDEVKNYGLENIISLEYRKKLIEGNRVCGILQVFVFHENSEGKKLPLAGVDVAPYEYLINYENMDSLNKLFHKTKLNFYRNQVNKVSYEDALKQYYEELNCTFEKTDLIIPGIEGSSSPFNLYPLMVLETNKVFPLKLIKFSDKMFPCPYDSDYYLKSIYNDYMSVPKLVHHHTRVGDFRYDLNCHEDFIVYINALKEVNENF